MALRLFCYRKGNSILHKIPAIAKILFMTVFCITVFLGGQKEKMSEILQKQVYFHILYCICVDILLIFMGKGKISSVIQMKWILWFGLLVTIFRLFPGDFAVFKSWDLYKPIFLDGLFSGFLYTLKFFLCTFCCQMIFETTSCLEIREGFDSIHYFVSRIFPFLKKFNLAFILSMAVIFIPEVFESWEKIQKSSKARKGNVCGIIFFFRNLYHELYALLSVLILKVETYEKAVLNRGFEM